MYIFLGVLFILLLLGAAACIVRYKLLPMENKSDRMLLIAGLSALTLVAVILLILGMTLPAKVDNMLAVGTEQIESYYNIDNPEASNRVIDKTQLNEILLSAHSIRSNVDARKDVSWFVQWLGMNAYIDGIDSFAGSIDTHLAELEAQGKDFTLHNILVYTREQAHISLKSAAKVIEIVVFILALFSFFGEWITYYLVKRERQKSSPVTYGEAAQ